MEDNAKQQAINRAIYRISTRIEFETQDLIDAQKQQKALVLQIHFHHMLDLDSKQMIAANVIYNEKIAHYQQRLKMYQKELLAIQQGRFWFVEK